MTTRKRHLRTPALLATSTLALAAAGLGVVLTTTGGAATGATPERDAAPAAQPAAPAPTAAPTAAPASDPRAGDPAGQQYLDDPAERLGELLHRYDSCLLDHGATEDTDAPMALAQGDHRAVVIAEPVPTRATSACADLELRGPRELDPRTNPTYDADAADNVACLRDRGVMVHLVTAADDVPSGLLWTYDSSTTRTPDDQAQIERECLLASFGD